MVYQNDKSSPDAQQPNLLTSSFERQPRHENSREGKTYAMTCIKKQAVETSVCKRIVVLKITQRVEGKKNRLSKAS
jgi:hypothetical protein